MAENSFLNGTTKENNRSRNTSIERNYSSTTVKDYVNQRREKAEKQTKDEKNGVSNTRFSEHSWDKYQKYN